MATWVRVMAALSAWSMWAQQPANYDLSRASLEDLMNIQVTSVSKKEQNLSKTGAAIFVITQEDIRRSGATDIPDVLRLAPGVDVARVDANQWAISIRGFNDLYANKVLVLIDGRSVYSPTFSGVEWDMQDVPLEDIERIEIIRGPGGTVWGANAVNGVINIITKSAAATKGGLISSGGVLRIMRMAWFNTVAKWARTAPTVSSEDISTSPIRRFPMAVRRRTAGRVGTPVFDRIGTCRQATR